MALGPPLGFFPGIPDMYKLALCMRDPLRPLPGLEAHQIHLKSDKLYLDRSFWPFMYTYSHTLW